jgi:mRNA interferase RelE/StbE
MPYKLEIKPSALKALEKIDPLYRQKIRDRIRLLATAPRHYGSVKLSGEENGYRTRVGKYRIVYEIYDAKVLVCVINVDHRKDVYR